MIRRLYLWFILLCALFYCSPLVAQTPVIGSISGQLRITRGDTPPRQIIVELFLHGAPISSVYTDAEGRFSFSNLEGNPYHVIIKDEEYSHVDELANVRAESPNVYLQIVLRPREQVNRADPTGPRASGGNPYLVDPADYNKRFSKKAIKEYQRGLDAEGKGKHDDAISHYLEALRIAPDYYPAHNNLGALYLSKADFKSAEEQFREAIRLDENDSQAYFNLGNLYLLTKRYPEAESALASGLQRRPDSAFGQFLEGCLEERTGKFAEAEANLHQALKLDPTMWQAQLQIANLYLKQNRTEDAIAQLRTFLKLFPSAPAAPKAKDVLKKLQSSSQASK